MFFNGKTLITYTSVNTLILPYTENDSEVTFLDFATAAAADSASSFAASISSEQFWKFASKASFAAAAAASLAACSCKISDLNEIQYTLIIP